MRACHTLCGIANRLVFPRGVVRQQALVRQTGLRFRVAGQPETKSKILLGLRRSLNICPAVGCRLRVWQCFSTLSEKCRKQSRTCRGCTALTAIEMLLNGMAADRIADSKWIDPQSPTRLIMSGGVAMNVSLFFRKCTIGCLDSHPESCKKTAVQVSG